MPQKKSAKKELRKGLKLSNRNQLVRRNIKEIIKDASKAIEAGDATKAVEAYKRLQKAVDKAVKSDIFKSNTGNRKKSRIGKKITKLSGSK